MLTMARTARVTRALTVQRAIQHACTAGGPFFAPICSSRAGQVRLLMSAMDDQKRHEALEALAARVRGADDAVIDSFLASSSTFLQSLEDVRPEDSIASPAAAPPPAAPPPAAVASGEAEEAVAAQGALIRKLKTEDGLVNSDPVVKEAVAELQRLKALVAGGGAPAAPAPPAAPPKQPKAAAPAPAKGKGKGKGKGANPEPAEEESMDDLMNRRLDKAAAMRASGSEPYAYTYSATHLSTQLAEAFASLPNGEVDDDAAVSVCGRVMLKREFGKLAFLTVQDTTGTVQLYLEKSRLGDSFKETLSLIDIGDIVGAAGSVKRTDKGELSVYARECTMLTKSLRPLPDKFAGLTDVNKRYRQRYLDMIVNPGVRETFATRARITSFIRRYLDERGFLEIETPCFHGEVHMRPRPRSRIARSHPPTCAYSHPPLIWRSGRWRGGEALRDLPQRARHAAHASYRHRALPEAPRCRRLRPGV